MPQKSETSLEFRLRVRRNRHTVTDYIFRGSMVEVISYFPDGKIEEVTEVTLETFIKLAEQVREEKLKEEQGPYA